MITVEQLEIIIEQLKAMQTRSEIEVYRCEGAIEAVEGLKVALLRQLSADDVADCHSNRGKRDQPLPCMPLECGADFGRYFGIAR